MRKRIERNEVIAFGLAMALFAGIILFPIVVIGTGNYSLQQNTVQDSSGSWVTSGGYYDSDWAYYNCCA